MARRSARLRAVSPGCGSAGSAAAFPLPPGPACGWILFPHEIQPAPPPCLQMEIPWPEMDGVDRWIYLPIPSGRALTSVQAVMAVRTSQGATGRFGKPGAAASPESFAAFPYPTRTQARENSCPHDRVRVEHPFAPTKHFPPLLTSLVVEENNGMERGPVKPKTLDAPWAGQLIPAGSFSIRTRQAPTGERPRLCPRRGRRPN